MVGSWPERGLSGTRMEFGMTIASEPRDPRNAIDFFTRNKHADYPEVVLSSVLSNLLDPACHLGFPQELLADLVSACGLGIGNLAACKVKSEQDLGGSAGTVDIHIENEDQLFCIEVKIWDRSAQNDGAAGPQLVRYARARQWQPAVQALGSTVSPLSPFNVLTQDRWGPSSRRASRRWTCMNSLRENWLRSWTVRHPAISSMPVVYLNTSISIWKSCDSRLW